MYKALICSLALVPASAALTQDLPAEPRAPMTIVDKKNIPIEQLAHAFLHNVAGTPGLLEEIISAEGADRISPEISAYVSDLENPQKWLPRVRQLCVDPHNARSGAEFSAALIGAEERDQASRREAVHRILAKLDARDRAALDEYLDTQLRPGMTVARIDPVVAFASGPLPTAKTAGIVRGVCEDGSAGV